MADSNIKFVKHCRNFIKAVRVSYEEDIYERDCYAKLLDACTRLEQADKNLCKYGRHTPSCQSRFIDDARLSTFCKCNCGFEQLTKQIESMAGQLDQSTEALQDKPEE